jgi:hypothetical protein
MGDIATLGADRANAGNRRLRRSGALAVLMTTVALVAGACSSSGDEKENTGSQSQAAQGQGGGGDMIAYAKCMRKNGLADFPDPQSGGGLQLPAGIDPNSDKFKKADAACKDFKPSGGGAEGGGGGGGWSSEDQIKFAQCMRDNGVPKFPDPDPDSKGSVLGEGTGVDPNSEAFKKAEEKCRQYQPEGLRNGAPNRQPGGSQ